MVNSGRRLVSAASRPGSASRPRPTRRRAGPPRSRTCHSRGPRTRRRDPNGRSRRALPRVAGSGRNRASAESDGSLRRGSRLRCPPSPRRRAQRLRVLSRESSGVSRHGGPPSVRMHPRGWGRRRRSRRRRSSNAGGRRGPSGTSLRGGTIPPGPRSRRRARIGGRPRRPGASGSNNPGATASNAGEAWSASRPRLRALPRIGPRRCGTGPVGSGAGSRRSAGPPTRRADPPDTGRLVDKVAVAWLAE